MATNDIQKLVSINFKKIRISRKLTQQDIADKINKLRRSHSDKKKYTPITRATISKYESGKLMISLTMLNDLCQVLNIKLTEIFKDLDNNKSFSNEKVYKDDDYVINFINFDKEEFEKLDKDTKNKLIDDAIFELSKLKHEINQKK